MIKPTPEDKISQVLYIIKQFGGTDSAHHKAWVIDEIVRRLTGDKYEAWVKEYESDGEYDWDTGIAP